MLNRRRMMMQAPSSAEEAWSYVWDYTMGAPDRALWNYPIGSGSATMEGNDGLYVFCDNTHSYAGLIFKDQDKYFGNKAVYEVEVKVVSTKSNGFRIVCTSGSNGVSDNHGLHVTINGNYLNVLTGNTQLSVITQTAPVTYGQWHKVRLVLDTPVGSNKVYLDGTLVATVLNASLSTVYTTSVWCLMQIGESYVRAVRYRKEN